MKKSRKKAQTNKLSPARRQFLKKLLKGSLLTGAAVVSTTILAPSKRLIPLAFASITATSTLQDVVSSTQQVVSN